MKKYFLLLVFATFTTAPSYAGTIDFTTGVPVFPDPADFSKTDEGVTFSFSPVGNLVGAPRFISSDTGLRFGGGGGSSLEFTFSTDTDVTLDSYTLRRFILGNPDFDIRDGANVISGGNDASAVGDFNFANAPVALQAGTTYSFVANTTGAGIQANLSSWEFSVVPEPSSAQLSILMLMVAFGLLRRRV